MCRHAAAGQIGPWHFMSATKECTNSANPFLSARRRVGAQSRHKKLRTGLSELLVTPWNVPSLPSDFVIALCSGQRVVELSNHQTMTSMPADVYMRNDSTLRNVAAAACMPGCDRRLRPRVRAFARPRLRLALSLKSGLRHGISEAIAHVGSRYLIDGAWSTIHSFHNLAKRTVCSGAS